MHQPGQVAGAVTAPGPEGLLEGIEDQRGGHRGGGAPAQDPAGVRVDDERDVDHPGPGRDVGEVGHPEPVRGGRAELPSHQVSGPRRGRVRTVVRTLLPRRAPCRPSSRISRSTVQRATCVPSPVQRQPHLPGPVDAVVLRMCTRADRCLQLLIAPRPGRRHAGRTRRSTWTGRSGSRARSARGRSARPRTGPCARG